MIVTLLGCLLLVIGAVLLALAAWGVLVLPDALSRQHAATKAATLALSAMCLGAAVLVPDWGWTWRLLLIVVFLLATLPVASHLLARAAVREGGMDAQIDAAELVGDKGGRDEAGLSDQQR